ncbi:restriction endonuclease [Olsenella profusa]|uniref:Restriction endonuclease n=1 Tax=Olsenella profusa F0195 TaxID=1125712 RepID=U2V3F5_9ACTN|nr:restriction endonuclease [Olsenella profusa]ERL09877.1 restriction endonuclease [Olsenella profusa F0195]
MGIFDKFNNQDLGDEEAFEELCCQLFETWGTHARDFDNTWTYRDIRGDGGDGGIEAYWNNTNNNEYVGIQAKWFRKSMTTSQYKQIRNSIDTAMELRPNMTKYIVCIPHNLTSCRNSKNKRVSLGEEDTWKSFEESVAQAYPGLELVLWDEHFIGALLQQPENEGRWRFWFERTAINPEGVRIALQRTLESLKDRYVPKIADGGDMAVFLDSFFGTIESRAALVKEIDVCLNVCRDLAYAANSFASIEKELTEELRESATRCRDVITAYADSLSIWRHMLMAEPQGLVEIDNVDVDYGAVERFEDDVQGLKEKYKLVGHVNELIRLIDRFRELPSEYEIWGKMRDAYSYPHCLVVGEQGTGKTCGFARKAAGFLEDDLHLPIFIRAAEINEHDGWKEIISNALGLSDWDEAELWQALSSSAAVHDMRKDGITVRAKIAVFVDGLDERQPASRWTALVRQGDAIADEYPRIRFAYSSRPYGIESKRTDDIWECTYHIDAKGNVPAYELFDRYIKYYSIDLAGDTRYKWMFRTPMELRMFCTAYSRRRIDKNVSTCLTALVNAEVDRLEDEYADRVGKTPTMHQTPVRSTLIALVKALLIDANPKDCAAIGSVIESAGIQCEHVGDMIDFLEGYGILIAIRKAGATSVSPDVVMYQPGSRHLWDYFMAVVLMETRGDVAANTLLDHRDARGMYAILLVEKRGVLPLKSEDLINALGMDGARQLTIAALADVELGAAGRFRQWALDEMAADRESLSDIVNGIVVQVANIRNHPLGPTLLDEYMRAFQTPVERDKVWSIPRKMYDDCRLSMYFERDAVKHMPCLHDGDAWNQMPLLLTWCLATVSNLRRRHCRNELVRWAMRNPSEFSELFSHFIDCNDPQIRENLFAIAAEVACQGNVDREIKRRLARIAIDSVFSSPDKPGNRDAAIRHYGRMIIEKCRADGVIDSSTAEVCRPPYGIDTEAGALPIYAAAAKADRMGGFETIHYDLARYVLVDKLETAFGIPHYHTKGDRNTEDVRRLLERSAAKTGIETPTFESWAIAAAYQYLIDHGYEPDIFVGPMSKNGYRLGGIDRKISGSFGNADHGSQSTVMTVAEKYVWCARNEICGFMADRVPVFESTCRNGIVQDSCEIASDYSSLLSYQSPLFEATVNRLTTEREDIVPSFPTAFSCDDGESICTEQELNDWIGSGDVDAPISLLDSEPNISTSIEDIAIPIALYASDWSICGKQACCWAYCGAMDSTELAKLQEDGTVAIDGYDHASTFATSINVRATYISPVEYMSAPWINEYDEEGGRDKIADVHVSASPLSGRGVESLTDIGDYWYRFPSRLAMDLCGVKHTDGLRYFNSDGAVIFEDVDYGEPYRKQYQALLANKSLLFDGLRARNLHPVWYATLQRDSNKLADERLSETEARCELSWLIWIDGDGNYRSCRMSDEHPVPEHTYEPTEFLKELLDKYSTHADEHEEAIE